MKFVALAVTIFKLHFIQDGAIDKFFRAKAVIDHRSGAQILHARLHGAAFVARSAVVHAEYGVELPFMLNNHARAKLCGFCAAHNLPIKCSIGNFAGRQHSQKGPRNHSRDAGTSPALNQQYKSPHSMRSIESRSQQCNSAKIPTRKIETPVACLASHCPVTRTSHKWCW